MGAILADDMGRAAILTIAVTTAAMVAMLTGSIAHDGFGIPLDAIRMDALSGAGLMFATVACSSLISRMRGKSK
jgi:hypothetical protein